MSRIIEKLMRAWELSPQLHELQPGAAAARVDAVERSLGRKFSEATVTLYRLVNGASLFNGNIRLFPLDEAELCVANASPLHRSWNWSIPDELILVGDNGAGDPFGLWLPDGPAERGQVVEAGRMFDSGSFAVAATSLDRYLQARTAYYLLLIGADAAVLDTLGMPRGLRTSGGDEPNDRALLDWADPDRPDGTADPYEAGLDVAALRSALATPCLPEPGGPPS
jgi:hypothetical protein